MQRKAIRRSPALAGAIVAMALQHEHLAPSLQLVDLPDDCLVKCLAQLTMSGR